MTNSEELADWLNAEPAGVGVLTDSHLGSWFREGTIPGARETLTSEIWFRRWLYAGRPAEAIQNAISTARTKRDPGFSAEFEDLFEAVLQSLDRYVCDVDLPTSNLVPEEKRIWGSLVDRIRKFLEADGLIALVPEMALDDGDGVALAFKFVPGEAGGLVDGRNRQLRADEWSGVLQELGDLGPVAGNQALQIEAVFPPGSSPGGNSLGLPVALAWARRRAQHLPLFSPLAVLATGEVNAGRVYSVPGTGGEFGADVQGGAKGQLAYRLGVKLYVAADVSNDFVEHKGTKVLPFNKGTPWREVYSQFADAIRSLGLPDARCHLRRVEAEDSQPVSATDVVPDQLWSRWRRLGRLKETRRLAGNTEAVEQVEQWRLTLAASLGFLSFTPGYCNFRVVYSRHPAGPLPGRKKELDRLDAFLAGSGGVLLLTGPLGYGKSALLTTWRRQVESQQTHSVFYHYFDHNDQRLQRDDMFYRRLLEYLLLEAEEQPPAKDKRADVNDVLYAWQHWGQKRDTRPLLLVIDGVDEIETCEAPFPDQLPGNVWLLLSGRSGEHSALHPTVQSWKERVAGAWQELPLQALDIPGLASWLATLDEHLKALLPPTQQLAAAIHDRTGGMALFIRHLLDDLYQATSRGERWEEVLERTPRGFQEYLRKQWERLAATAGPNTTAEVALNIIAYLVVAHGTLTNRELLDLLGRHPLSTLPVLPSDARRWIDIQSVPAADSSWGDRFMLNHWLIREVIAPIGGQWYQLLNTYYAPKLFRFCQEHWRDGSPYALRQLPEHLIERRAWKELDDLLTGSDGIQFQRLQERAFPDEPALALSRVRRALEREALMEQPDPVALTELSLTHATLVRRMADPINLEETENLPVLELADRMTRLPVQWDPAAEVMWHLLVAWLCNREGHSAERNRRLNVLGRTRIKLPTQWVLLASALLPGCFQDPANPWLLTLASRLLPDDGLGDLAHRLARRGRRGWVTAAAIVASKLKADSWTARRARQELIVALAEQTEDWGKACDHAFWDFNASGQPHTTDDWMQLADKLNALGRESMDEPRARPALEQAYRGFSNLVASATLTRGVHLKSCEVLGHLAAWRLRLELLSEAPNQRRIKELQENAEHQARRARNQSAPISIHLELAEAFAIAATGKQGPESERWRTEAKQHRQEAEQCWERFRSRPRTHNLEKLQHWFWLAQTTLRMIELAVWSGEEARSEHDHWASQVKAVLGIGSTDASRGALARLLSAEPSKEVKQSGTWRLEPAEWDDAIVTAVEVLRDVGNVSYHELATTICRAKSDRERARAISRCIQYWTKAEDLERLLESDQWHQQNRAAAWATWFRHHAESENTDILARYAARSILEGTARLHGVDAFQRVELLAEVAMASSDPDVQNDGLRHTDRLIERSSASPWLKARIWLNLAAIARPIRSRDGKWSSWPRVFFGRAQAEMDNVHGHRKVELLAETARRSKQSNGLLGSIRETLSTAEDEANRSPHMTHRIAGLCEIAEAAADCCEFRLADELLKKVQHLIPSCEITSSGALSGRTLPLRHCEAEDAQQDAKPAPPLGGLKVKKVRPYLVSQWLLALSKAATRHAWTGTYQRQWVTQTQDAALLNGLKTQPDAYQEACRAVAVADAWRCLFDADQNLDQSRLWHDIQRRIRDDITDPAIKARTHRDIAVLEATKGHIDHALRRIDALAAGFDKDDVLHRVGSVLARNALSASSPEQRGSYIRAFLRVLPPSTEYFGSTYLMLASLIRLFPGSASAIHELLQRRKLIDLAPCHSQPVRS